MASKSVFAIGCDNLIVKFRVLKTKFSKSKLLAFLSERLVHPCRMRQLLLLHCSRSSKCLLF